MTISPQVPHRSNYAQRECSSCPPLELNSLRWEAEKSPQRVPPLKWWAFPFLSYQDWGSEEFGVWRKALDCHRACFNLDLLLWFVLRGRCLLWGQERVKAEERPWTASVLCNKVQIETKLLRVIIPNIECDEHVDCQYFSKNLKADFSLIHFQGWCIFPQFCE